MGGSNILEKAPGDGTYSTLCVWTSARTMDSSRIATGAEVAHRQSFRETVGQEHAEGLFWLFLILTGNKRQFHQLRIRGVVGSLR